MSVRPENGGKSCSGGDQKYKTCSTDQVTNKVFVINLINISKHFNFQCTNAPQLTLKDFANEICLRAKEYDTELLGTGYQKISSDRKLKLIMHYT